jgi:hypothetical protein
VEFPPPPDDGSVEPPGAYASGGSVATTDSLGVIAIVFGCIGIVFAGIVLAIVTAVLASVAGSQARAAGRSLENAYIAFGLAVVDGVVWLVLHMLLEMPFLLG